MYYVALYIFKNTQKKEKRAYLNVTTALTRRIHRQMANIESCSHEPPDFAEGLSWLLSGIRAHMSSSIISPPLAHLMVCQDSIFTFSHDFSYLLVSKIEDYLDDKPVNFKSRNCKGKHGKKQFWADSFVNDIVYRSDCLAEVCAYELILHYERGYYNRNNTGQSDSKYPFLPDHPGVDVIYHKKMKKLKFPSSLHQMDIMISLILK